VQGPSSSAGKKRLGWVEGVLPNSIVGGVQTYAKVTRYGFLLKADSFGVTEADVETKSLGQDGEGLRRIRGSEKSIVAELYTSIVQQFVGRP
jgi:hypothetical protein